MQKDWKQQKVDEFLKLLRNYLEAERVKDNALMEWHSELFTDEEVDALVDCKDIITNVAGKRFDELAGFVKALIDAADAKP